MKDEAYMELALRLAERGKGWTKKMPRRRRGIEKNDGPGADWGRR